MRDYAAINKAELCEELHRKDAEIERLRAAALWHCQACGSLSRDGACDCTRTGTGTQRLVPFDPIDMKAENDRLRADNDRLRAAIKKYIDWCCDIREWQGGDVELKHIRDQMGAALVDDDQSRSG